MPKNSPPWKLGRDSLTKLWVRFKDGNQRERYSLDWKGKDSKHRDRSLGIERLERLVRTYGPTVEMARIYDLQTDKVIAEWHKGQRTL